ncbi:MAG: hypothetical protein ACM34K_05355 [Bacillota bacterium]
MASLTLENFLYVNDFEISQYKILGCLKNYREEFNNNNISNLTELSTLVSTLIRVEKKRSKIIDLFPVPVKKVDAEKRQLVFDNFVLYDEDVERIFDLIKWAIPVIHETIDEALCLTKVFKKESVGVLA